MLWIGFIFRPCWCSNSGMFSVTLFLSSWLQAGWEACAVSSGTQGTAPFFPLKSLTRCCWCWTPEFQQSCISNAVSSHKINRFWLLPRVQGKVPWLRVRADEIWAPNTLNPKPWGFQNKEAWPCLKGLFIPSLSSLLLHRCWSCPINHIQDSGHTINNISYQRIYVWLRSVPLNFI